MKTILLFLFFTASCTSLFKSISFAPENEYPKASREKAMVYFMRSSTFAGSSSKWIITETRRGEKSKNIGIFAAGSYFYKELEPGETKFEAFDPGWGNHMGEKKLTLERGKTYYLNLVMPVDGEPRTGLVINNSFHLKDELENMKMVDLKASKESWIE